MFLQHKGTDNKSETIFITRYIKNHDAVYKALLGKINKYRTITKGYINLVSEH